MGKIRTCKDFCRYLSDYLDGEVGEEECRLIEAHLKECRPCSLAYKSLCITVDICGRGVSDEIPKPVRERLKAFLEERCKGYRF